MNLIEITTRIVYLQPNAYSEEALAVGVLYDLEGSIQFEKIGSVHSLQTLNNLYDEEFTEQVIFSLKILDEHIAQKALRFDESIPPIDLFRLGSISKAVCENPHSYVRDLLRASSSLFHGYSIRRIGNTTIDQEAIEKSLKDSIVRLNPLKGSQLIQSRKIDITSNRQVNIPLYGAKVIGAPISLFTPQVDKVTKDGEAFIARLKCASETLEQRENIIRQPMIYVYAPDTDDERHAVKIEDSIGELEFIGKSIGVEICSSNKIDTLARKVYEHESVSIN
jgi:hypothetical protein